MLRHVIIKREGNFRGRYAVLYDEHSQVIKVKRAAGQALPVELLIPILRVVDPEIMEKSKEAHQGRKYPWRVKVKDGMSGCLDISIENLIDEEMGICRRSSKIHISMFSKLNEDIFVQLEDLYPIAHCPAISYMILKDKGLGEYTFEVRDKLPDWRSFNSPGVVTSKEEEEYLKACEIIEG